MNDQAPEQQPIEAQAAEASQGSVIGAPPDGWAQPATTGTEPAPAPTSEPAPEAPSEDPATTSNAGPAVGSVVSWEHATDQGVWTAFGLVVDNAVELGQGTDDQGQPVELGTGVRVAHLHDLLVLDADQLEQL